MTEQRGDNVHVRRVDVRAPTADERLQDALKEYARSRGLPEDKVSDAFRAALEAFGVTEDAPSR